MRINENPADILSRGSDADKLVGNKSWWNGNKMLHSYSAPWNTHIEFNPINSNLPERKNLKRTIATARAEKFLEFDIFIRYSNYHELLRITVLLLRFAHNSRKTNSSNRVSGVVSRDERNLALYRLVLFAQRQSFDAEINLVIKKKELPKNSRLISLSLFLYKNGILRVGGRFDHTDLSHDQRHPMLLSHKYPLVKLLVNHEHLRHLHGSHRLIKSSLGQKFWILRIDSVVRTYIKQCIDCLRYQADSHSQFMVSLPSSRVTPTPHLPFTIVSVDYARPSKDVEICGRGRKNIPFLSVLPLKRFISN